MLYAINSAVYLQFLRTRGGKGASFAGTPSAAAVSYDIGRNFTE